MTSGLSVVVPAYNESEGLRPAIAQIRANVAALGVPFEIVIVNDGSKDDTGAIANAIAAEDPHVRVIHHARNRRVGAALKTGAANVLNEWMVLNPVDNAIPTEELRAMLAAARQADIVVGYRGDRPGYHAWMKWASGVYRDMLAALFRLRLRDYNWCCLYRTEVLRSLPMKYEGILGFPEMLIRAHDAGYELVEVPLSMKARVTGRPTVSRIRVLAKTSMDLLGLAADVRLNPTPKKPSNGKRPAPPSPSTRVATSPPMRAKSPSEAERPS
jgi:glycosyltransferase involved in cell wall biosynthesis